MRTLFQKILRDLRQRPLRSFLTVIGIALGVAGIVAISFTGRNLTDAQRETYASTRQPDISGYVSQVSPVVTDVIARRENVEAVDSRLVLHTRISAGGEFISTRLNGIDNFTHIELDAITLAEGRFPGPGEVALDITSRDLLNVEIGSLVALQQTTGDRVHYGTVSGFVRVPATLDATFFNRINAFIPAEDARRIAGRSQNNYLMIQTNEPQRASQTASDIQTLLAKRGINTGSFTVRNPEVFTGSRELSTLILLLQVFSAIGALLSSFLVANTIAAVMVEETRQVGVLKAIGAKAWQIAAAYITFAALLGFIGSVAGLLLGVIGGRLLTEYLSGLAGLFLPGFGVHINDLILALATGTGIAILAALFPILKNIRQPAIRLLNSAGVKSDFRSHFLRRLTAATLRLNTVSAMGLRNAMRRPARALITLLVVSIAVASFTSTEAINRSVNHTVNDLYSIYDGDGWISFRAPISTSFARRLEQDPSVVRAEPWTSAQGSIGFTPTTIWGVPEDTNIYRARVISGQWLGHSSPPGAVLTVNLAEELGAQVGDLITVDAGERSTSVQVRGIVDDESTYLGTDAIGKVFLRIEDQQRLLSRGNLASIFALQLVESDPEAVDRILRELEETFQRNEPSTVALYEDQESAERVIGILTLMLNTMVLIVAIVGLAGIINTLIINLTERRREFGILRSIGAMRRDLISLVMAEGVGIAIGGFILGIILGYPIARYLVQLTGDQLFRLEFQLSVPVLVLAFIVAILASAAVSLVPGLIASRIRPIQVLRYE